jgi:glycosyltransferase involved in cell wall biosynthesis
LPTAKSHSGLEIIPKVSVIVPNYNHARYLRVRLDSILRQTFTDYEIIILDDASTDESKTVIAPYLKNPRISFHPNAKNSGTPFAQWNLGVRLARGEFVWIAESDDIAQPEFLEKLVPLLAENPKVGIAYCQSLRIGPDNEPLGTLEDWTTDLDASRWKSGYVNAGRDECRQYLLWKNILPNASAVLFRKATFLQAGGAPEHMRLCGDWLNWVRMLLIGDIAYTPALLNRYRKHSSSVRETTGHGKFFDEKWAVQLFIARECKASPAQRRELARQNFGELLMRIRTAPPSERRRCTRRGLLSFWPFFRSAPATVTRCFFQRHQKEFRP